MAKIDEQSRWNEWNKCNDTHHDEATDNREDSGKCSGDATGTDHKQIKTTFCKTIPPPQVTHVEQAERHAVHSCLHHSYTSHKTIHENNNATDDDNETARDSAQPPTNNYYSNLPTPHENNAICFWMTNVLELLDIPERHLDRQCTCVDEKNCSCDALQLRPGRGKFHGDMYPYRPLQLPDLNVVRDALRGVDQSNADDANQKGGASVMSKCDTDCEEEKDSRGQEEASLPPSVWEQIVTSANPSKEAIIYDDSSSVMMPLEQMQLAVSFRADLPSDVPPTMSAECVKYFYSAVLLVTTTKGEVRADNLHLASFHSLKISHCMFLIILQHCMACSTFPLQLLATQCPFTVLTSTSHHSIQQHQSQQTSLTRVHIGDLRAIAHSAGLPTYISSTEVSDATPTQLTVVANPPACDIVSRRTAEQRTSTHRIQDGKERFCGLMTLVGIGGPLVPGTRLGVRIKLPIYEDDENDTGAGIIPCHRVCCALVGEEYAIFEGSSTGGGADNLPKSKKRVKTRSYVFDSAYEMVEFGYTEAISMGLVLPLDCPVTVKTDLVEVSVMLKVEFTVGCAAIRNQMSDEEMPGKEQEGYSAIRLDLPCEVVSAGCGGINGYAEEGEDDNERRVSSIRTMQQYWTSNNKADSVGFDDTDIQKDLKMLSLQMIGGVTGG